MGDVEVRLVANGQPRAATVEPRMTLADFLRERCGLTGTHLGCEHGVCGACTVLLDGEAVRSCLVFAVQADGAEVTTVEGVADRDGTLSPVQAAFRDCHGLQCGFCTPGFVMTITALLPRHARAHRRPDPRRLVRQPVPLHRLPGDHRGRAPSRDRRLTRHSMRISGACDPPEIRINGVFSRARPRPRAARRPRPA